MNKFVIKSSMYRIGWRGISLRGPQKLLQNFLLGLKTGLNCDGEVDLEEGYWLSSEMR